MSDPAPCNWYQFWLQIYLHFCTSLDSMENHSSFVSKIEFATQIKVASSNKVFQFGSNLQKWALSTCREDAQGRDLALIFGDLTQSEKRSEIKPHLGKRERERWKNSLCYLTWLWRILIIRRIVSMVFAFSAFLITAKKYGRKYFNQDWIETVNEFFREKSWL